MRAHLRACVRACVHARARMYARMRAHICAHVCARVCAHVRACMRACITEGPGIQEALRKGLFQEGHGRQSDLILLDQCRHLDTSRPWISLTTSMLIPTSMPKFLARGEKMSDLRPNSKHMLDSEFLADEARTNSSQATSKKDRRAAKPLPHPSYVHTQSISGSLALCFVHCPTHVPPWCSRIPLIGQPQNNSTACHREQKPPSSTKAH